MTTKPTKTSPSRMCRVNSGSRTSETVAVTSRARCTHQRRRPLRRTGSRRSSSAVTGPPPRSTGIVRRGGARPHQGGPGAAPGTDPEARRSAGDGGHLPDAPAGPPDGAEALLGKDGEHRGGRVREDPEVVAGESASQV